MSWEYTMYSGYMTIFAIFISTSRLRFCINALYLWANTFQHWKILLSGSRMINSQLSHFLRPFWPQIYAISLFPASFLQRDYGLSPPQSPSSHSCSGTSQLVVIFDRGY